VHFDAPLQMELWGSSPATSRLSSLWLPSVYLNSCDLLVFFPLSAPLYHHHHTHPLVMDVAGTAIGFWEYQKTQEVSWSQYQLRFALLPSFRFRPRAL
jgi:hypothetical protein